jgi:ABC-type transporter Mla subunit MlaD
MRRLLVTAVVLAIAGAFALLAGGAGGSGGGSHEYWVELDNAFGLVEGADLKVGGVRAGKIVKFKLDKATNRALVGISVTKSGFDSFRTDATCESLPQSLIGEYFLNCQPGTLGALLHGDGGLSHPQDHRARIGVSKTTSTIPGDLVGNIMRRPYRERLRIILGELGAGVGGRAQDLNDALRRFNPALRQTDRVLAILARENQTLKNLTQNADTVVTALARNKGDVGRFVITADRTARASADRQAQIAGTFHRFPGFLEQLRPSMAALGRVADEQTPALRDLNASAHQLERFFGNLRPFSDASRPAFRTLADASKVGRVAVKAATPSVAELNRFGQQAPEVSKNLAMILQHLDDPQYAVETDQRAAAQHTDKRPNYTGVEALLQYVFDQSTAINIFDKQHYILKVDVFRDSDCAPYADLAFVKANPAVYKKCTSNILGPRQPGITEPDTTATHHHSSSRGSTTKSAPQTTQAPSSGGEAPKQSGGGGGGGGGGAPKPPIDLSKTLQDIQGIVQGVLPPGVKLPNTDALPKGVLPKGVVPKGVLGASARGDYRQPSQTDARTQRQMLDYLLAP